MAEPNDEELKTYKELHWEAHRQIIGTRRLARMEGRV